ncbi:hypothetical protein RhiirC2_790779 [Rhizophagus irregularis]|uniref:Uncharacterized protein n=2 Tax=Rhizophagus irregularis TaxID=588596 RepID=A0A2N1MKJ9_9GLOM|nr:hypothetical protein RhiirC2_790779 [Rhizophagus irregularis]
MEKYRMTLVLIIAYHLHLELQLLLGDEQQETLREFQEMLEYYLAHLTRKGYLNSQFNANLLQLNNDDFYAKRGWALHTVLVYSKNQESNELEIQAFDHWSNDNRQDTWFTASSFDAVFTLLDLKPKWVIIMSDNGPHYHCSETMALVSKWAEWYNIEYIEKALDGLSGTAIAYLKPNRDQKSQSNVKTIPGISNWFEWSWPTEGPLAGYICARDLSNFGEIMTFSVSKFTKTELVQPEPMVDHTYCMIHLNNFHLVVTNTNHWDLRRWTVDKLKDELNRRNIHFDIGMGRGELVNLLKQEIGEESQIGEESREDFSKTDIDENQIFHLQLGWALKCNQKYGKKGSGKRLVKEVVTALTHFFMVGQRDPSDRYTAKDMLDGLKEMAENGEITTEVIPTLKTIENWITRYSSLSKKEHAERFLEE